MPNSPFSLPEELVEQGRHEREDAWLGHIASGVDRRISDGMSALTDVARRTSEPLVPFARLVQGGELRMPSLDDLTPDTVRQRIWAEQAAQPRGASSVPDLSPQGTAVPSVADLSPARIPGPDQSPQGTPIRSSAEMGAPTFSVGKSPEGQARVYQVARSLGRSDEDARILAAVTETEGGWGGAIGDQGQARGIFQFHEGGEMPAFRSWVRQQGIPGDPNQLAYDPDIATRYAATTYLGRALDAGKAQGLAGADLATYVQRHGQRSIRPETTGANYQRLFGAQGAPTASQARSAPTPTSEGMVSYRDPWDNEFTVPESKFNARPGGNADVTVVSRTPATPQARQPAPVAMPTGAAPPIDEDIAQAGLDDPDKWSLCGPVAAVIAARARGKNWTVADAKKIAQGGLWDASTGMYGLGAQVKLLNEMGLGARTGPAEQAALAADARAGNTPIISTPKHYFILKGYSPETGQFDTTTSGTALKGGSRWLTLGQIAALGGGIQGAAYMDNPASPTPSVAAAPPTAAPGVGSTSPLDDARAGTQAAQPMMLRGPLGAQPELPPDEVPMVGPGDGGVPPGPAPVMFPGDSGYLPQPAPEYGPPLSEAGPASPIPGPDQTPMGTPIPPGVGTDQPAAPTYGPADPWSVPDATVPGTLRPGDLPNAGQPGRGWTPAPPPQPSGIQIPDALLDASVPRAAQTPVLPPAVSPDRPDRWTPAGPPAYRQQAPAEEVAAGIEATMPPQQDLARPQPLPTLPGITGRAISEAARTAQRAPSQQVDPLAVLDIVTTTIPIELVNEVLTRQVEAGEWKRMVGTDPLVPFRGLAARYGVTLPPPEEVNPDNLPASSIWAGIAASLLLPDPTDPIVGTVLRRLGRVATRGGVPAALGAAGAVAGFNDPPEGASLGERATGALTAGAAGVAAGLAPRVAAGPVGRAVGQGAMALAREGAEQLMALTPQPRMVQSTGGGAPQPREPGATFALGPTAGERYELRARVVPLEALVTSHTDALVPNQAFPAALQPRLRERAASRVQIDSIANQLDPEQLLVDTHALDRGSPIIGPDGIVESGNGRTLALRQVARDNPEKYAAYVAALRERLPDYGLPQSAVQGIEHPVLVRERVTDVDRPAFAAAANQSAAAQMSPIERARQDAGVLSDATVGRLTVQDGQSIDAALLSPQNRDLVRAYVGAVPETERAAILDASGNLNTAGLERLKSALLVRTYPGAAGQRIGRAFIESTDPGVRVVEQAVYGSLPAMARAEALVSAGVRDAGLSVAHDVAAAVDAYARLRRAKLADSSAPSVREYLSQGALFGERELTPIQERLLGYLDDNARSPRRIRDLLERYADAVDQQASPDQVGMFGDVAPVTKEEVLDGVLRGLGAAGDDAAVPDPHVGSAGTGGQELARSGAGLAPLSGGAEGGPSGGGRGAGAGAPSLADEAARIDQARRDLAEVAARSSDLAGSPGADPVILRSLDNEARRLQAIVNGEGEAVAVAQRRQRSTTAPAGSLQVQGQPASAPRVPASEIVPATGGPPGQLAVHGAPPRAANLPPVAADVLPPGGPEGTLTAPDLIPTEVDVAVRKRFSGKPEKADEVLANYAAMKEAGADEVALHRFLNTAVGSWSNRIGILRFAGMLSSTYTQATNTLGTGLQVAGDVLGTVPAVGADVLRAGVTRTPREVYLAELPARLAAMRAASATAAADAAFTLRHGIRPEDLSKLDHLRGGFATNIPGLAPAGTRRAGALDILAEYPLRAMAASDVYFRSLAKAGHLAAEATARAAKEGKGRVDPARVAELMTDKGLMLQADELARKTVLQEERGLTTGIREFIEKRDPVTKFGLEALLPFVRTPYNIVAQGLEMTPLGAAKALRDVRRGSMTNRELSGRLAKATVGTAIGAIAYTLAADGHVTGAYPEDARTRSTLPPGWRPFSAVVTVGGETRYVPLAALGPLAIPASLGAILGAAGQNGQEVDPASVAESVGRFAEDQTFLRSLFDGVEAVRRGGNALENYLEQVAASYSPHVIGGGALGRQIQQAMGMAPRDPEGAIEALMATFPYTAGQVPPRLDVLGRETTTAPSGVEALIPNIRTSIERDEPVIAAYRDAGQGLPRKAPDEVRDPATNNMVELDREDRLAWREAFGQALEQRWVMYGRPSDARTLQRVEREAREEARRRVIGR